MNLLNLEDEKFADVNVQGYNFKIRYISPMDRIKITHRRMALQNGQSIECLTQDEFTFFENIAMVDICTEEMPKEFNKNESCTNWQDINLINILANEIKKHTATIEDRLKKNKPIE